MYGLSKPEHKPVLVFIKLIAPSHKITPPLNYQAGTDTNQPQCTVKNDSRSCSSMWSEAQSQPSCWPLHLLVSPSAISFLQFS